MAELDRATFIQREGQRIKRIIAKLNELHTRLGESEVIDLLDEARKSLHMSERGLDSWLLLDLIERYVRRLASVESLGPVALMCRENELDADSFIMAIPGGE